MTPPRLLWHGRQPWIYTYREGGFEGYVALFTRRRRAPDLRWYANWKGQVPLGDRAGSTPFCGVAPQMTPDPSGSLSPRAESAE